jgi:hypothetical protein
LEAGIDAATREQLIGQLERAGIPLKIRKLTRKDFGSKAAELFDYLGSSAYADDLSDGKGVCLSGDPAIRSDLLALMAKAPALAGRSTSLISLHSLVPAIENNPERRDFILRAEFVFIDWFEREFKNDTPPYSYHQLCDVEDFLASRMHGGRATHFSASNRWGQLKWWSKDFLGLMQPKVQDIVL